MSGVALKPTLRFILRELNWDQATEYFILPTADMSMLLLRHYLARINKRSKTLLLSSTYREVVHLYFAVCTIMLAATMGHITLEKLRIRPLVAVTLTTRVFGRSVFPITAQRSPAYTSAAVCTS